MATAGVGISIPKKQTAPSRSWWVGVAPDKFADVARTEAQRMNESAATQVPAKWPAAQEPTS